jgi:hypothetical protein
MEVFTTWSGGASSSRWLGSTLLEQNYQRAGESPASTAVQEPRLCDEFRR